MTCENKYKRITIRTLFNSLEEVMARNPQITLDSEVIISDLNMGVFKSEVYIYPTHDYKDRKVKVGIYLNPYEKDELIEETTTQTISHTKERSVQAMVQEEPETIEVVQEVKPQQDREVAWLDKWR